MIDISIAYNIMYTRAKTRIKERNNMTNKKIEEMTEKEILRRQLELLAEESKNCTPRELTEVSNSILNITLYLDSLSAK